MPWKDMGYYMRFIVTDDQSLDISLLECALKGVDPNYSVSGRIPRREAADLTYGGDLYGEVEINRPGDGLFEEEIEELMEAAREAEGKGREVVMTALSDAKVIVALQVLLQGRTTEDTLLRIDPLWTWLFENRKGLLQADGEGFYRGSELTLETG